MTDIFFIKKYFMTRIRRSFENIMFFKFFNGCLSFKINIKPHNTPFKKKRRVAIVILILRQMEKKMIYLTSQQNSYRKYC